MVQAMIQVLKDNCFKGRCIYESICTKNPILNQKENETLTLNEIVITLESLSQLPSGVKPHIPCVMVLIQNHLIQQSEVYREILKLETAETENLRLQLATLAVKLCNLPDLHYPLKLKHDSESDNEFTTNHEFNPKLTHQSLCVFIQILYLEKLPSDDVIDQPSKYQKFIVKKTCVPMLLLVCSRLGNFSWTNELLKPKCDEILNILMKFTMHSSISSLLSGSELTQEKQLFSRGILANVLDELSLVFKKDLWNKNLPWKHSLIWCVTKVKYPNLGRHVPRLVPYLLLMVDDYVVENKLFGISTLLFVISNVNPSDLNLYNHSKVIYDALFLQLYSSKDAVYEIAIPCLHKILKVIEPQSGKVDGVSWTLWDDCIEKIVQNIEFSNHIKTRRVLLKFLPLFICDVGVNIVKHVSCIFKAMQFVLQFTDTEGEVARIQSLVVLQKTITNAWVIMPRYQSTLLKTHIKLFMDVKSAGASPNDVESPVEERILKNLMLLRKCCGESFDRLLQQSTEIDIEESCGKSMQTLLKSILELNVDSFYSSF